MPDLKRATLDELVEEIHSRVSEAVIFLNVSPTDSALITFNFHGNAFVLNAMLDSGKKALLEGQLKLF